MRIAGMIAVVGAIALLVLPTAGAQAATYTWQGSTSDFWLSTNWSATPDWTGSNTGAFTGNGVAPVLTASGSVFALTFGTNDGLTLGSNSSSNVLSLVRNSANGAAITSSVTTTISANLASSTSSNAIIILANGANKTLTLSGNLSTPAGSKWGLSTSANATLLLSGTNTFASTLTLGGAGVVEASSAGAINNWNGAISFGDYVNASRAGGATLKLDLSYNLNLLDMEFQTNGRADNLGTYVPVVQYYIETANGTTSTVENFKIVGSTATGTHAAVAHKTGGGTLILVGTAGTLTGNASPHSVEIDAGTLLVNNASGSPIHANVPVNVNNGGVFGGTGTVSGLVTVKSGGHLAPGASVGYVGVGSLTLEGGSILDFEFNGTPDNDLVVVSNAGGLTINGGQLYLYQEGTTNAWTAPGVYALIQYAGGFSGDLANLSVANAQEGLSYDFSTYDFESNSYVILTISGAPVPEPATLGLLALGGLGMIGAAARRRRRA